MEIPNGILAAAESLKAIAWEGGDLNCLLKRENGVSITYSTEVEPLGLHNVGSVFFNGLVDEI